MHAQDNSGHPKARIDASADKADGFKEFPDSLKGEEVRLHGHKDLGCSAEGIDREYAEARGAVDEHNVPAIIGGFECAVQPVLTIGDSCKIGFSCGKIGLSRNEVEIGLNFNSDVRCLHFGIEQQVVDGRVVWAALDAEVQREVCLWIEIYQAGLDAGSCQCRTQIGGGGRFAHTALLVDNGDNSSISVHSASVRHRHSGGGLVERRCISDTERMTRPTDSAIVLRRWEYSETSQTVAAISREHGIVRGLAKGALRSGSAFSGGFEPLTRGHLGWLVKPGRDLAILTEWMLEDVYWATRQDPAANRAGIYALDLVSRLLRDEDPHPSVYDDLDRVLQTLAEPPCPSTHLLQFQWSLLGHVGWQPDVTRDVVTGESIPADIDVVGFRSSVGGIVSCPGEQDWRVRRETVEALASLGSSGTAIEPAAAVRASGLMAVYVRDLLGDGSEAMRHAFPELC